MSYSASASLLDYEFGDLAPEPVRPEPLSPPIVSVLADSESYGITLGTLGTLCDGKPFR